MNSSQIPVEATTWKMTRINFVVQSREVPKLPWESICMRPIIKLSILHCSSSICLHYCSYKTQKSTKFTIQKALQYYITSIFSKKLNFEIHKSTKFKLTESQEKETKPNKTKPSMGRGPSKGWGTWSACSVLGTSISSSSSCFRNKNRHYIKHNQ